MLLTISLFPLLAALGCAVCAETVDVVVDAAACVVADVVVVVVLAEAIAIFASNPEAKYNVPFTHDKACATGRLATGKSALPPVAVVRLSDVIFVFLNTAYPQEFISTWRVSLWLGKQIARCLPVYSVFTLF